MALPEVPGIIEAVVAITRRPDGRVSFRIAIGTDCGRLREIDRAEHDLVELIISPEHVGRALAGMNISAIADTENADEPPTFPCHIGLHRGAVHSAA
jgi:hypothetical protein